VLAEEGYIVWGASMVRTEDGTCHLFYCRWRGRLHTWYRNAQIVCATSNHPLGPYKFQHVALGRKGAADWERMSVYNPSVMRVGEKYYLYYTGSNGSNFPRRNRDGTFKRTAQGSLITQRIGVAVADRPAGPWKRLGRPVIDISSGGIDSQMCCNPTVTQGPDGRWLMVYKCSDGKMEGKRRGIYLTVATAESPTGPFKKTNRRILSHPKDPFPVEDPFVWYADGRYRCLADDQQGSFSGAKGLVQFESANGLSWTRSDPFVLSRCQIAWADGTIEKTTHLERPAWWFQNGKPAVLFLAVWKDGRGFNIHVPTKWLDEKTR